MKKYLLILLMILFVLAYSCKKDDPEPEPEPAPTPTKAEMARDTLYAIMKDLYFWYKEMPKVDKNNYSDPYKLLEALRYKKSDRFSFVADYDEFNAEFEGEFVGHGIRVGLDPGGKARISMIYTTSPLYAQGVRRGWIVKTINGYNLAEILLNKDGQAYNAAFGPSTAGVTNNFVFIKPDNSEVNISSTKSAFNIKTVLAYDTLHLKTGITGHLVLEAFINHTQEELNEAFAFFKANNVTDMILDLRYNSGGYVDQAVNLASYIGGNSLTGTPLAIIEHNDMLTEYNQTLPFRTTNYSLQLPRVVVITTRLTASASEFVINGLKPHINVVTIGDTTYGKPVGFYPYDVMKLYTMCPAAFRIVNSAREGDYYFGMVPNKLVVDDITHDFTDRKEANLKEAIRYLETGSWTTKSIEKPFKNSPQYSERPEWMNNMFLEEIPIPKYSK